MQNEIEEKWKSLGGKEGLLGSPHNESKKTIKNDGLYQRFEYGTIFWNSGIGSFEVYGGVEAKYMEMGYEASFLGFPITDTTDLGQGCCYNNFQGGAIYFHPLFSGIALHGPILTKWKDLGAEQSALGYPVGDTQDLGNKKGQYQRFQYGDIYWHPDIGAFEVRGRIKTEWKTLGGPSGKLGYPISEPSENESGSYQNFQHGTIIWQKKRKQVEVQEYKTSS